MAYRIPCPRFASLALRPRTTQPPLLPGQPSPRYFSTSGARRQQQDDSTSSIGRTGVPPESPLYINIAADPFADQSKPERVRGRLPVPRKVFPRQRDAYKVEADYVDKAYPRPSADKGDPKTATQEWKRLMAETRRQNLQQGLQRLWQRKTTGDGLKAQRLRKRIQVQVEASTAPVADHDKYTQPTLLPGTLRTRVEPDPKRFEKAEKRRKLRAKKEESERMVRRDAVLELYLNAADFIMDEKTLEKEVHRMFSDDFFTAGSTNAWSEYGYRPGLADLLTDQAQYAKRGVESSTADFDRHVRRQKAVTEELTGGKLDNTYNEGQ